MYEKHLLPRYQYLLVNIIYILLKNAVTPPESLYVCTQVIENGKIPYYGYLQNKTSLATFLFMHTTIFKSIYIYPFTSWIDNSYYDNFIELILFYG